MFLWFFFFAMISILSERDKIQNLKLLAFRHFIFNFKITFLCDLGNSYVIALNSIINLLEDFTDLAVEDNVRQN